MEIVLIQKKNIAISEYAIQAIEKKDIYRNRSRGLKDMPQKVKQVTFWGITK